VANSEAIAWYVEEAQRLLEEQQRRVESLRTRGGQIAGFGALFLALVGGNAARILGEAHGGAKAVIAATLVISSLCLIASVAAAVIGANKSGSYSTVGADEIANFLTRPFLDAPELWRVQVRSLRALEAAAENAQKGGDDALKSIAVSLYTFLVGLGFAVASVGILIGELI
jgi:hypothetical protein